MLDAEDLENVDEKGITFKIRSVFIIDPVKKIRLTMMYPASCGRKTTELLRVIDLLQTADKKAITTPINWQVGDDVIVLPTVSTEDAKKKFGEVREVRPYLRYTKILFGLVQLSKLEDALPLGPCAFLTPTPIWTCSFFFGKRCQLLNPISTV
jgi:hypothetical protein